jgi:hypothetical protein
MTTIAHNPLQVNTIRSAPHHRNPHFPNKFINNLNYLHRKHVLVYKTQRGAQEARLLPEDYSPLYLLLLTLWPQPLFVHLALDALSFAEMDKSISKNTYGPKKVKMGNVKNSQTKGDRDLLNILGNFTRGCCVGRLDRQLLPILPPLVTNLAHLRERIKEWKFGSV